MIFIPPAVFLFFGLQLPATLLLGMVSGLVAVHVCLVRRGQLSLRTNGVIVLLAALEAAVLAPNPAVWLILVPIFLVGGAAMALVDLGIVLGMDARRPLPRFSRRFRRVAAVVIPSGLIALGGTASGVYKYGLALNPAGVAWFDGLGGLLILLAPLALVDLIVRVVLARIQRRSTAQPT